MIRRHLHWIGDNLLKGLKVEKRNRKKHQKIEILRKICINLIKKKNHTEFIKKYPNLLKQKDFLKTKELKLMITKIFYIMVIKKLSILT